MKRCRLGDVATVYLSNVDKKSKENQKEVVLCNYVDVYKNWAITNKIAKDFMVSTASDSEIEKFTLRKGNVALTKDSETRDDIGISTYIADDINNMILGYHNALIIPNEKLLDGKYLNAYLHSQTAKRYFELNASGSGQRYTLTIDSILDLIVYMPELDEQRRIGNIFSSIDKKIENNNAINNNLEQQAMSLYDYWFTQYNFPDIDSKPYKLNGGILIYNNILKRNIPKDWIVAPISEHTNIYQPQTISNELFNETYNYEVYGGGGLIGRYFEYNHKESEVIISCRGNCGNFYFTSPKSWITGNAMVVNPKDKNLSKYYLYHYFMRYGVKQYLSGSVQKQLTRENLSIMNIVIPPKNILEAFDKIIKPIFDEILNHKLEITKLNRLKNWLLPLLMNGQATIKE